MIYMGCVTDMEWKRAVMEVYPDRKPNSKDSAMRKKLSIEKRDIPELAQESCRHEARRYYAS